MTSSGGSSEGSLVGTTPLTTGSEVVSARTTSLDEEPDSEPEPVLSDFDPAAFGWASVFDSSFEPESVEALPPRLRP